MASGTGPAQMAASSPWHWCTKASAGSTVPDRHGSAADRNGLGFSDHVVEHLNSERGLAVLTRSVAGVKLGTDQALVSTHCRFRVIALPVSGRALPANAAPFGHELDVMIAQGLLIRISCAQHGVGPGWDEMDHLGRRPGLPGNGRNIMAARGGVFERHNKNVPALPGSGYPGIHAPKPVIGVMP